MLFKMTALFVIAATTRVQHTGSSTQWIYESGPNQGYLCAVMEQDGSNYDVFVPSASPTPGTFLSPGLLPVPWQHFTSKQAAVTAVSEYCAK